MTSPNTELMSRYGTQAVYQQKLAGAASLTERLLGGLAGYGLAAHNRQDNEKAREQGALMSEMFRELELLKIDQAAQLLRGTPLRRFAQPSMPFRDLPRGRIDDAQWDRDVESDDGTIRLASIAAQAGADIAKEAGLGDFAGFAKGLATKAVGALKPAAGALKPAASVATQGMADVAKSVVAPPGAGGAGWLAKGKELLGGKLGLGVKGNLALAGLAAGGLYLGNKTIQKGTQVLGSEASPATYGGGSHGYRLPMSVNADGQPQL